MQKPKKWFKIGQFLLWFCYNQAKILLIGVHTRAWNIWCCPTKLVNMCMLFYRSVVVVCKNMNATDVERLVPRLSLPGCNPKDSRKPQTPKYKGRCIELQNQRNKTAASAAMAIADSSCRGKNQAGCTVWWR